MDFFCSKNCLTLFVTGREKIRAFSCTLSVLAPNVLDQNSEKKENCPKPKMTPFFEKGVFWHG